jgi:hypothetical protein
MSLEQNILEMVKLAKSLDDKGLLHLSSDVDRAALSLSKVAQEVSIQGHWIRNERCWSGCYRTKRTASPNQPTGAIWNACYEEFAKALKGDTKSWDKYASGSSIVSKKFAAKLEENLESQSLEKAVPAALEAYKSDLSNQILDISRTLYTVASKTNDSTLSKQASDLADNIIKEAQLWNKIKDFGKGVKDVAQGLGRGISNVVQNVKNIGTGFSPQNLNRLVTNAAQFQGQYNNAAKALSAHITPIAQFARNPKLSITRMLQSLGNASLPVAQLQQNMSQLSQFGVGLKKLTESLNPAQLQKDQAALIAMKNKVDAANTQLQDMIKTGETVVKTLNNQQLEIEFDEFKNAVGAVFANGGFDQSKLALANQALAKFQAAYNSIKK